MKSNKTELVLCLVKDMGTAERSACLRSLAERWPIGDDGHRPDSRVSPLEERWWLDKLVEGQILPGVGWPREVRSDDLADEFARYTRRANEKERAIKTTMGMVLKRLCPQITRSQHVSEPEAPSAPGKRQKRHKFHVLPTIEETRRSWQESGRPAPWATGDGNA